MLNGDRRKHISNLSVFLFLNTSPRYHAWKSPYRNVISYYVLYIIYSPKSFCDGIYFPQEFESEFLLWFEISILS
jgi:hypothetical protein